MKTVLWLAAAYNLLFGALVLGWPSWSLSLLGIAKASPLVIVLWQCIGMIVGVYGIGYGCAALAPYRHWPIILVGFLGKLFGPIGLFLHAPAGHIPWRFGWLNLTNDVIWWVPFALILLRTYRARQSATGPAPKTTTRG